MMNERLFVGAADAGFSPGAAGEEGGLISTSISTDRFRVSLATGQSKDVFNPSFFTGIRRFDFRDGKLA